MSHAEKLYTVKNCWFGMETAIICSWGFQLESRLRHGKNKSTRLDKVRPPRSRLLGNEATPNLSDPGGIKNLQFYTSYHGKNNNESYFL